MKIALTAFTKRGVELAADIVSGLNGEDCKLSIPARLADQMDIPAYENLGFWAEEAFQVSDALVFVGAAGIAVRAIAPYVQDKLKDPAVISVDEFGKYVIPLLSGHVGGANSLACRIAEITNGVPVISTATDINGLFAVDEWAVRQGLAITDRALAKEISVTLLEGGRVGFACDGAVYGGMPKSVYSGRGQKLGFAVTVYENAEPFERTLRLIPKALSVGVGCRRGTSAETIAARVDEVIQASGLSTEAIAKICTIDLKSNEIGLLEFCRSRSLPLEVYTAEELRSVAGEFTASELVMKVTGVDNVCERAAVLGGGRLIINKQAADGVTIAVAIADIAVSFE